MASIVIKDLPESVDLDRQAMTAITGGARSRARRTAPRRSLFQGSSMISTATGLTRKPSSSAGRIKPQG